MKTRQIIYRLISFSGLVLGIALGGLTTTQGQTIKGKSLQQVKDIKSELLADRDIHPDVKKMIENNDFTIVELQRIKWLSNKRFQAYTQMIILSQRVKVYPEEINQLYYTERMQGLEGLGASIQNMRRFEGPIVDLQKPTASNWHYFTTNDTAFRINDFVFQQPSQLDFSVGFNMPFASYGGATNISENGFAIQGLLLTAGYRRYFGLSRRNYLVIRGEFYRNNLNNAAVKTELAKALSLDESKLGDFTTSAWAGIGGSAGLGRILWLSDDGAFTFFGQGRAIIGAEFSPEVSFRRTDLPLSISSLNSQGSAASFTYGVAAGIGMDAFLSPSFGIRVVTEPAFIFSGNPNRTSGSPGFQNNILFKNVNPIQWQTTVGIVLNLD